jgi:hypothetical protein
VAAEEGLLLTRGPIGIDYRKARSKERDEMDAWAGKPFVVGDEEVASSMACTRKLYGIGSLDRPILADLGKAPCRSSAKSMTLTAGG